MKIVIKNLRGKRLDVEIDETDRIKILTDKAYTFFGYREFKLNYLGTYLSNDNSVKQSGLKDGCTILIVVPKADCTRTVIKQEPVEMVSGERTDSDCSRQDLINMGYSEERVDKAMEEAAGDPDFALDILVNGRRSRPTNLMELLETIPGFAQLKPVLNTPQARSNFIAQLKSANNPLGALLEQNRKQFDDYINGINIDPRIIEGVASCLISSGENPLEELSRHPCFLELKVLLKRKPNLYQEFMDSLNKLNPVLTYIITSNSDQFQKKLDS